MKNIIKNMCLYNFDSDVIRAMTAEDSKVKAIGMLADFAKKFSLCGNIWHKYIAYLLCIDENAFSLSAERKTIENKSFDELALADMYCVFELLRYDFSLNFPQCINTLFGFKQSDNTSSHSYAGEKIDKLADKISKAENPEQLLKAVKQYYAEYGVGEYGLYNAFRLVSKQGSTDIELQYISHTEQKKLSDLVGYEMQKKQLLQNTLAFLDGKTANNVLLYGDGGTGKSSSIKALLNEYGDRGLRVIEVYKHQFTSISELLSKIKDRNYRFIIYLDDLSFEEFETEYKYFKAIIEGGIESRPSNVLIYATSNRRHLIKETFADRNDMRMDSDEVHRSDSLAEKLSLVARFGLTILYTSPNQDQYLEIVKHLAKVNNIEMDEQELCTKALQWQMRGSGKSGRTAQQFIDSLAK